MDLKTGKFWLLMIFTGSLLVSFSAFQAEAKTRFLGFKIEEAQNSVPSGWNLITYFRTPPNEISLSKEGKRTILKMKSIGSASAVVKILEIDLKSFPVLVWRWKINRVPGMAIETKKDRNDSAARVRVIFGKAKAESFKLPPEILKYLKSQYFQGKVTEPEGHKIDYIWGNRLAKGEIIDFPGSKNHKVVIVETGDKKTKQWIWEKRNLLEDYQKIFNESPLGLIGIVVATDTDQTNEGVTACYSSIVLMDK